MSRFLFPLLMLILIAIAGLGGAGRYLNYGPLAPFLYKPEAPKPPPEPKHHKILLGELVTPIVRNHAIASQVALDLEIDVYDDKSPFADIKVPLLMNEMSMAMLDFVPNHGDVKSSSDKQAIHDRLVSVSKQVLGPDAVRELTIRSFYNHS